MRLILVTMMALAFSTPASGEPALPLPSTPEDSRALAQRFADCSARLQLDAYVARLDKRPDVVTAAEYLAGGWKVTGIAILAMGMKGVSRKDAEGPFDTMVQARLQELKARYARDPAKMKAEAVPEFNRVCAPLFSTQWKVFKLLEEEPSRK